MIDPSKKVAKISAYTAGTPSGTTPSTTEAIAEIMYESLKRKSIGTPVNEMPASILPKTSDETSLVSQATIETSTLTETSPKISPEINNEESIAMGNIELEVDVKSPNIENSTSTSLNAPVSTNEEAHADSNFLTTESTFRRSMRKVFKSFKEIKREKRAIVIQRKERRQFERKKQSGFFDGIARFFSTARNTKVNETITRMNDY